MRQYRLWKRTSIQASTYPFAPFGQADVFMQHTDTNVGSASNKSEKVCIGVTLVVIDFMEVQITL